jgi:phosphatidylglycerophosphatase C
MSDPVYPKPRPEAPLVVFDFDHTLYDGDSGGHLVKWLIRRNPLRTAAALAATVLLGPMVAFLPTRRRGISGYIWIGTFGLHGRRNRRRTGCDRNRTRPAAPRAAAWDKPDRSCGKE